MTKRILYPLFVFALSAPIASLADTSNVNVYGVANISYDLIDTGTATNGTQGSSIAKASSNASRIGFKGTDEIGNGFTTDWQIETLVLLDNSSNSCAAVTAGAAVPACNANTGIFATRNSYAGLSSKDYGSLLVGRYDTPYKISTRKLDNFNDSIADNRSLFGTVSSTSASNSFVTKQPDVIAYTSPDINGISVAVAYVNLAETATTATAAKASASSIAAMYNSGSIYGSFAYETHLLNSVRAGSSESAWVASLGYTLNEFSLAAAYESTSDTLGKATSLSTCSGLAAGADCFGHQASYLTGKYSLGSSDLKLAYTSVGSLASAANTGANQVSFGYDFHASKRSTLFALYTRLSNESKANYSLGSAAFSDAATTSIGAGAATTAISFGLKQVF